MRYTIHLLKQIHDKSIYCKFMTSIFIVVQKRNHSIDQS